MKKTTSAFIAMLLAIILALFSACNSTVPPIQPGEGISSPTEDNSFDESVPEELSEPPIETDVSANMSDPVDIPPLGTPSKLIPIVEFGFGDGDYELGYSEPDDYGFIFGPNCLSVNGNDILINDCINRRLLVYRDGKLIDKVDTGDYPFTFNCTLTDDYYYVVDEFGSVAYRIDRQTKEFQEIDFEAHDCSKDNDYTWSFKFEKNEGKIYIRGRYRGDDVVCYLIDGATAPATALPLKGSDVSYTGGKYVLNEGNSESKELDLIPQVNGISAITGVISRKNGSASIIYQNMEYRDAEKKLSRYYVYYKLSSDGTVIGRYIQFVSNDSYKPPYYATLNSALFREAVTDSGDLFVVNGDEDHVGIYKVVFGMDELSIDISDEEIEVQGDLLNKQSPISNEVNALSSEDMTYHPRVTRETAEQRALQMINLTWDLTQANKQKPAGCTHSLSIPPHVLSAPVGATMTGIPYCVAGGNGLEYLQGASAAKNINFDEAMRFGKVAGNISGVICDHAAGLDCSGYASSVYKYQNKYYSNAFLNAGKNIGTCEEYEDLNEVLDKMDLLVQISNKNHIFIFIEQKIEDNVKYIYFYNCTQNYGYTVNGERGPHNKALKGKIGKNALDTMESDLTLHKMWNCTYSYFNYNDTQHGRMRTCNTCEPLTYLPHEFSISVVNANYHETTCYCGYRLVEGHTFSSPMPICTVCGYLRPYSKGVNGQAQLEQDFIVS